MARLHLDKLWAARRARLDIIRRLLERRVQRASDLPAQTAPFSRMSAIHSQLPYQKARRWRTCSLQRGTNLDAPYPPKTPGRPRRIWHRLAVSRGLLLSSSVFRTDEGVSGDFLKGKRMIVVGYGVCTNMCRTLMLVAGFNLPPPASPDLSSLLGPPLLLVALSPALAGLSLVFLLPPMLRRGRGPLSKRVLNCQITVRWSHAGYIINTNCRP